MFINEKLSCSHQIKKTVDQLITPNCLEKKKTFLIGVYVK